MRVTLICTLTIIFAFSLVMGYCGLAGDRGASHDEEPNCGCVEGAGCPFCIIGAGVEWCIEKLLYLLVLSLGTFLELGSPRLPIKSRCTQEEWMLSFDTMVVAGSQIALHASDQAVLEELVLGQDAVHVCVGRRNESIVSSLSLKCAEDGQDRRLDLLPEEQAVIRSGGVIRWRLNS